MNLFETYHTYFQQLAVEHPDILHTPERKAFEMIGVEEAVGDFRTVGKKGVIMRLLEFSYSIDLTNEPLKRTTAGFMVLNYHSSRKAGSQGFIDAIKTAEAVTRDIIQRMIYDSLDGHILFRHSLTSSDDLNVGMAINKGDIGYSGFLCTYTAIPAWRDCFEEDAETPAWVDGGLTPHEL